jgi:hypothetical protein
MVGVNQSFNKIIRRKVIVGNNINWDANPIMAGFGDKKTSLKLRSFISKATPNITIPMAILRA